MSRLASTSRTRRHRLMVTLLAVVLGVYFSHGAWHSPRLLAQPVVAAGELAYEAESCEHEHEHAPAAHCALCQAGIGHPAALLAQPGMALLQALSSLELTGQAPQLTPQRPSRFHARAPPQRI